MNIEFPNLTAATPDERTGIAWWNSLSKEARLYWLNKAGSAVPARSWSLYKLTQAARAADQGAFDVLLCRHQPARKRTSPEVREGPRPDTAHTFRVLETGVT